VDRFGDIPVFEAKQLLDDLLKQRAPVTAPQAEPQANPKTA
jgi:hypothetical protein